MRFAVVIGNKVLPVKVMREPNNTRALSTFLYVGRTYRGIPEQFNGLKLNKDKNSYTAVSIIVIKNAKIPNIELPQRPEIKKPILIINPKVIHREKIEQELNELKEEAKESESVKEYFFEELQYEVKMSEIKEVSKKNVIKNENKKIEFSPRWHNIAPHSISYMQGLFEQYKNIWINRNGSNHLKMANEMQCKCNTLYIQERAGMEFPDWEIDSLLIYYEVDSPDFGVLSFLRNFKNKFRDVLNQFKSKIIVAKLDRDDNDYVVIADYLGHCDLFIELVKLVDKYGDEC